ncbi:DNA repair protein RAD50 [Tanacetum coccineum]
MVHGLSTLYRRSSLCSGLSLLVVGDTKGAVFGGLVEAPLRPSTKKRYQMHGFSFCFVEFEVPEAVQKAIELRQSITQDQEESETLGSKIHGLEQNVKDVDTKLRQNEATIKELRKLQDQVSTKTAERSTLFQEQEKRYKDLREENDARKRVIESKLQNMDRQSANVDFYIKVLDMAKEKRDVHKSKYNIADGMRQMFDPFERVARAHHICPCCERPFSAEEEDDFVKKQRVKAASSAERITGEPNILIVKALVDFVMDAKRLMANYGVNVLIKSGLKLEPCTTDRIGAGSCFGFCLRFLRAMSERTTTWLMFSSYEINNSVAEWRRALIRNMWNKHIKGTKRNVEVRLDIESSAVNRRNVQRELIAAANGKRTMTSSLPPTSVTQLSSHTTSFSLG